jgi:hypothetical protein
MGSLGDSQEVDDGDAHLLGDYWCFGAIALSDREFRNAHLKALPAFTRHPNSIWRKAKQPVSKQE